MSLAEISESKILDRQPAVSSVLSGAFSDGAVPGAKAPAQNPDHERSVKLGWAYDQSPDIGRLQSDLSTHLSFSTCRRLGFLPALKTGELTTLWIRANINWDALLEIQAEFGLQFEAVVIPEEAFNSALQRAFEKAGAAAELVQELDDAFDLKALSADLIDNADLMDAEDDAPIIRLLNAIMTQAIEEGASDVHIEPFESRIVIRFRVDGTLRDVIEPPRSLAGRIAARIKVMAKLNIAEKRVPQDGRISLRLGGRNVDVRVSTLPTHYGERVVMRILEKEKGPLLFEQIGMPAEVGAKFSNLIHAPHGIFLVTGPTGSGKTTTLYAALQQVQSSDVNIITAEDPVEYDLPGVCQIPVNNKTGMTFERGLRAILRQDPDVIMVGEIRDLETARISVQASLTGHRVFSTLHTNDAAGSITRLIDMGIEPYLVASSLLGVMAQRLLRKLCPECKQPHQARPGEAEILGIAHGGIKTDIYSAGACESCSYTGYQGRTGAFELMTVNEEIRYLIHQNSSEQALRELAFETGMQSIRECGLVRVLEGDTCIEEVMRVSQA